MMAQAPATPKAKRATLRAATTLLGAERVKRRATLLPSERAALDLRLARRRAPWRAAEEVIFLIPLVGPDHVGDWAEVTARLNTTLQSLQAQEDPRWRAVICCQTHPEVPADPRIHVLPFDDPAPGNDKWRKLARLNDHLKTFATSPAYVMSFDADDLLHRTAVGQMLTSDGRGGYLVETGFVMDHSTGAVALAGPRTFTRPLRKPFWKLCGSCVALHHDPALPASQAFLREMTQHEHRMFPYLASLAGMSLDPFADPLVLYVLNHGENFGARRGRIGFKTRFVARFRIDDDTLLESIQSGFPQV